MLKQLILISIAFALLNIAVIAKETTNPQDWDDVDGVTVQSEERVNQIKAYKKKQREAEIQALKKGWNQDGMTVQSEERVKHLNALEKSRRDKEIKELKCTICTTRCGIVSDAGKSTCGKSSPGSATDTCIAKADNFRDQCLSQCDMCL